jgi:hypothetical protein
MIEINFDEYVELSDLVNKINGNISESEEDPLSVLGIVFKNAISLASSPIIHSFLKLVANMTMKLPKNDNELIEILTKFARTHDIAYKNTRGHSVYQFLPGVQITIKSDITQDLKVSDVLINNTTKLSTKNFNDLIVVMMKSLLSDSLYQLWIRISEKLRMKVFQKMVSFL